jgi:nitrate/TMAO reductase-like tetraheme cytochrome c subunit
MSEQKTGKLRDWLQNWFSPPPGSPRWAILLPYLVLGILSIGVLAGASYGWEYTNSPAFCGTTCHTMPPQNATYLVSPHANVTCSECHIGRASLAEQVSRKTEDVRELYAMIFHTYEFPIRATRSRPALQTCERCHSPETFSDDSLRTIVHYGNDDANTRTDLYLVMHTGGGSARQGLGRGIHWHIENPIYYYASDAERQEIPYVRVENQDGTFTEYTDVESGFDPASLDESSLIKMDCITCHNRVTHHFNTPEESVDSALQLGQIDAGIPQIRRQAIRVLRTEYASPAEAQAGISSLRGYYQTNLPGYFAANQDRIDQAIGTIQEIYTRSVWPDQEVDWTTYPDNIGHINSPGCFRCHDGKHLSAAQEAIRLECNLCHSIPVVTSGQDFIANIQISLGPEPASHLNTNWISLHNQAYDASCTNCHDTSDPGGTSNTSFCSNSACHGSTFTYAGFDAPALRATLQDQMPPPASIPTPAAVAGGIPTFEANIQPILAVRCVMCHNSANPSAGLSFDSFAEALTGGRDGAIILPGNSAGSLLIQVQSGQHFASLLPEELELVRLWIDTGAQER